MKYQLVLQWPALTLSDFDKLIEIEDALIENLTDLSKVDGHDFGSGTANIFIFTDHPSEAFAEIHELLGSWEIWNHVRAAYREAQGVKYHILWPNNLSVFEIL